MTSSRRTWWITGASRGLGRALAETAAARGDLVVATGRDAATLPSGDGLVPMTLDVRDEAAVVATAERIVAEHGRVDVVVNNAGYGLVGAVEELTDDELRGILDTTVLGSARVARAALPHLRRQGSGHLLFVSTTGAVGTMPLLGAYNAAKWSLEGMAQALAGEVAGTGVRVSILEPGGIDTDWGTSSMAFADPLTAYDALRETLFGTAVVPWPVEGTGGGTPPAEIAAAIVAHVDDESDDRLRVLLGDDAPEQVAAALHARLEDYQRDPRFVAALAEVAP
ncbi:SDR family NAD(P)-dependent oxidoreductase [Aeromicrobium sp. Leaf350]|uniref:SDR family NAD(P)-dependent oxidoreductase n=1 Tax=Aeromicrobium sp. Leaf350 TaxID=2876565 RepID=UPI001E2C5B63|nr:SDR family NAD(P)-dependent oxidoreductase [Aeromicrobium sp. Leaf350]